MRRDGLIALLFALVVAVGAGRAQMLQEPPRGLDVLGYGLVVTAALGVALRRRVAVGPLVVAVGCTAVYLLLGYAYGPVLLTVVVGMFEFARRRPLRQSGLAGVVAALVVAASVLPRMSAHFGVLGVGAVLWGAGWLAVPWSVGALVYVRRRAAARERAEMVQRAVIEERMRVSRDVHDVAGHGFAVVAMQAGAALVVFDERPEQAREALRAIRDASRGALQELRAVLENLDSPGDIAGLVEQARRGDVQVRFEYDGLPRAGEHQRRIAFEVVREGLTNAIRHGVGTASLAVRHAGDDVVIEITNPRRREDTSTGPRHEEETTGTGPPHEEETTGTGPAHEEEAADTGPRHEEEAADTGPRHEEEAAGTGPRWQDESGEDQALRHGAGRGIVGMRERVEGVGGSFAVRQGRLFEVHARIPR